MFHVEQRGVDFRNAHESVNRIQLPEPGQSHPKTARRGESHPIEPSCDSELFFLTHFLGCRLYSENLQGLREAFRAFYRKIAFVLDLIMISIMKTN